MNMKRSKIAILLALSLGITSALTACGGSSQSGGSAAAEPAAQEEAEAPAEDAEQVEAEAPAEDAAQVEAEAPAEDTAQAEAEPAAADQAADGMQDAAAAETDQALNQAGASETPALSAAEPGADEAALPVADQFHVELEEVGRVSGKNEYRITYDSLLHIENDHYTFCDYKGNPVDPRPVLNLDYLGWGLYSVTLEVEGEVNSTGLVDAEGDVLIPFDAAIIEFPHDHPVTERPRYVLVMTGTEITDKKEEALFFATDRMFAITANDEDVLYKGTLKVFDLETKQYVNGLEYARGTDSDFAQIGDNILSDAGDKTAVYSPDGKEIYVEQGSFSYNHKYMMDRIDLQTVIMDENAGQLYTTEAILNTVDYNSEYFTVYNNGKNSVINCKGEPVLSTEFDYIYGETKNRFRVKNNGDANYSLVAQDGSAIASGPNMFDADPLGFQTFGENKNYSVVTPGNRIIEGLESDSEFLAFTKDDETSYLILNTGEFASCGDDDCDDVGKGVIALENGEDKHKLVDVFTGNDLSGFDYDEADDLNDDYLYVEEGDDIVIYKTVVVPEG